MSYLKQYIERNGYRQRWIAENILGISRQHFWKKLHGLNLFTTDEKEKLAEFFDVPVEELFGEADPVMN